MRPSAQLQTAGERTQPDDQANRSMDIRGNIQKQGISTGLDHVELAIKPMNIVVISNQLRRKSERKGPSQARDSLLIAHSSCLKVVDA